MTTMSRAAILAALDGGRLEASASAPVPFLLSAEILRALGIDVMAPRKNFGWRQRCEGMRYWTGMWRPTYSLEDAVLLAEHFGLAWSVQAGPGISTTACVYRPDDLGRLSDSHHGPTPAHALTRAIVAEML